MMLGLSVETYNEVKPHRFQWAGHWCHAHPSCGLFIEGPDILVVSDMHLEKASHFVRKGQFLPPYDTAKTLTKLIEVIAYFQPRKIVSLGDSFHDDGGILRMDNSNAAQLALIMQNMAWVWVTGNHDPADNVQGANAVQEHCEGEIIFRHEPNAGHISHGRFEIAGHFHPCATIAQRGRHLRRRCFAYDHARMIMPAFGSFTGSLNIADPAFEGMFEKSSLQLVLLGSHEAHAFPPSACMSAR